MKKIVLITSILLPTLDALQAQSSVGFNTNATYLKIVAASNSIPQVVKTLPEVEKLWPQNPIAYLESLSQAIKVLNESLIDTNAKPAFIACFTNMMNKACPTNEVEATAWVNLKCETILAYGNCEGIYNDKSQLLAIAKFLGEIRSKTIPNYKGRAATLSIIDFAPGGEARTQKAIEDNDRNNAIVNFQFELPQVDSKLLSFLCPLVQSSQPMDTNFIHQISTAAHLTDAEKQSLIH